MTIWLGKLFHSTLGTREFSRVRREFSVLAEGRSHERRSRELQLEAFDAGHYKDLTETRNRARKVSGTQGSSIHVLGNVRSRGNS